MIELKEKYKILVMVILLAIASFLSYYFHAVLRTGVVFTHFFYIPIILAAIWWKRKGLIVVIFLAALLILSDIFLAHTVPSYDDIPRIFIFMVVGFLVAVLSETIVKSDELVNGRTSELREGEAKYRTLYESSSDAIMMLDEKGFFDCNNATLRTFGFSEKEDFTRVHPADLSPPYQPDGTDSLTAANKKIAEAFRKGTNFFEWMHRRTNGEDFPADVLLTAFQLKGKQVLQATVRDITERKRAEELLNKSKEFAETVLNSMNDAISVIDVNNFKIIDVNTVFLHTYGLNKEDVIGRTCHEVTHKCAEPCTPPDDICPLLDTLSTGKHSTAEHVHYIKDEGGTVTIIARKEGNMAEFSVSDTGIGIKEEDMENIFKKFTQLDNGMTRKYGGTGIGLAIAKQLVELHGGTITAESRYGEGSTFTFSIPLKTKRRRKNK